MTGNKVQTSISVDARLWERFKKEAKKRRKTISGYLEEVLESSFDSSSPRPKAGVEVGRADKAEEGVDKCPFCEATEGNGLFVLPGGRRFCHNCGNDLISLEDG